VGVLADGHQSLPKNKNRQDAKMRTNSRERAKKGNYTLDSPRKPVSLWDMIRFFAKNAVKAIGDLEQIVKFVNEIKKDNPAEILSKGHNQTILSELETTQRVCETLNLSDSKKRATQLKYGLRFVGRNVSEVYTDLAGLFRSFMQELQAVNFVFIPNEKLKYLEKALDESSFGEFGEKVYEVFPNAWNDITDAGDSLAADLHDAAVFYLMRVVETGLRDLARNLRVKPPKKPLDYAGWSEVVKAIDNKLSAKIPKSRSAKKIAALKFKHDLLVDFKAFEVDRNEIMHGRSHYNEQEAIGLFYRVRDFMHRLATHL
jgi:hypothetical protein